MVRVKEFVIAMCSVILILSFAFFMMGKAYGNPDYIGMPWIALSSMILLTIGLALNKKMKIDKR